MDAATVNSIRRKLESLRRMTEANGCTPAEAKNAAKMAQRLEAQLPAEEPRHAFKRTRPTGADREMWRRFYEGMRASDPPHEREQYRSQSIIDDIEDHFPGIFEPAGKIRL